MSALEFGLNTTYLQGKQGKLPVSADGYYTMMVGAYNLMNSMGDIYALTARVKALFQQSTMVKWCSMGQLFGEADHPSINDFIKKGISQQEAAARWLARLAIVEAANQSHHIRKFWWQELPDKVDGRTIYGVFAELKPLVEQLRIGLETPDINTAMSVRSFLHPAQITPMGTRILEQKDLFTYDWVTRPGLHKATKYNTPGLESEVAYVESQHLRINEEIIDAMVRIEEAERAAGNESGGGFFDSLMVKNMSGQWQEVENLNNLPSRLWLPR